MASQPFGKSGEAALTIGLDVWTLRR